MEARLTNAESLVEQANNELLALRSAQKTASKVEIESQHLVVLEKLQKVRNLILSKLLTFNIRRYMCDVESSL